MPLVEQSILFQDIFLKMDLAKKRNAKKAKEAKAKQW